ncbi:MAG: hypothetical protein C4532_10750 [Candidatus Abyssobacteria bacterium SURF_17]|uniref:Cytochrome c-552/4 domain-containing protein n=1 Tax=Candidatus Abyssobacteria bacterium SURF_17 TaxID=2093361 RepID=A0A419EXQ6_9BACT|nr:MAG: hypothetical protein C4532_10750 [Candidatus Abyssubacteria bacterium SURF_17]
MLLFDNGDMNASYGRQPELKFETMMKGMAEMGYDAVNVGEQDLLLGLDYVKYVADFTGVPFVSANIVDAEGKLVFQEYARSEIAVGRTKLVSIAVGIISPSFKEEIENINPGISFVEYEATLKRLIPQLRKKADLLVVLAHMNEDEAALLAERLPQIDLIIVSHSGDDPFAAPAIVNEVPIVFAGARGMHVGAARFAWADKEAKLQSFAAHKLAGTFADSPRMSPLLADYQQMLKVEKLLESYPRSEYGEVKFTGNKSCQRCHSLPMWRFGKEKHAHAFEVIVEKKHEYDPECVRCHTTGFGYVTGFIAPELTPELEHVGCENCHGPGSKHIEEPLDEKYGEVARETCESCHNPDNSPKFVYEEYLKKIKHNSIFLCSARICHWLD